MLAATRSLRLLRYSTCAISPIHVIDSSFDGNLSFSSDLFSPIPSCSTNNKLIMNHMKSLQHTTMCVVQLKPQELSTCNAFYYQCIAKEESKICHGNGLIGDETDVFKAKDKASNGFYEGESKKQRGMRRAIIEQFFKFTKGDIMILPNPDGVHCEIGLVIDNEPMLGVESDENNQEFKVFKRKMALIRPGISRNFHNFPVSFYDHLKKYGFIQSLSLNELHESLKRRCCLPPTISPITDKGYDIKEAVYNRIIEECSYK